MCDKKRWARLGKAAGVMFAAAIVVRAIERGGRLYLRTPPPLPETRLRIYVAVFGFHSAILIEQPKGSRLGPPGNETARYVEYGFGDKEFFRDLNFWPTHLFAAGFIGTPGVIYLNGRDSLPNIWDVCRFLLWRDISLPQWELLVAALEAAIKRWPNGERTAPYEQHGHFPGRFYPCPARYVLWHDCNRWTVDILQKVGLADTGQGVVFAEQIEPRLHGFKRTKV